MKKLYTLFAATALFASAALNAQVAVTFKVDITEYLAVPNTLGANGMRIGGNFTTNGVADVPDWTPSSPACALTQEGSSNVWGTTITFPTASVGDTLQFKFVNNDWGTNEGATGSEIVTGGCGVADAGGNINRILVIPATATTLNFCYEKCTICATSINDYASAVSTVNVYPNPANEFATLSYDLASASIVSIDVFNALGQKVNNISLGNQAPGAYKQQLETSKLVKGIYFVRLNVNGTSTTTKLNINF
jgi:hypothetical protein